MLLRKPMLVSDLVEFLLTQPQDLAVAFKLFSEQRLMELKDIRAVECCEPRSDGWIQDARPDMPARKYLMFPGN